MFSLIAALSATLLISIPAAAGNGGSVYSRFGIGDRGWTTSPELFGMGGTGLAVTPLGSVNDLNPATWAGLGKIRFSAGSLYQGYSTSDGTSSEYLAGMQFSGAAFAIPISPPNGVTFAAGVLPYSRVNYEIVSPESRAGLDYVMTYTGEGGISTAYAGVSVTPAAGLHLGARLEYLFGSLRYSMHQEFPTSAYAGTKLVRAEHVRGFGSTMGAVFENLGPLFGLPEDRSLAVGVTFSPTTYPTAETERIYTYNASPSNAPPDSSIEGEADFRLPFVLAGGISYRSAGMLIAMDVRYQEWARGTFGTGDEVGLRNSTRISAGVEFFRNIDPNPASSRKTSYTFGVFHDGGYLEARNTAISENGLTAGISFPILGETRLSLAAGFSIRGTNDNLLQQDKIIRFSASLDISELWFQRPVEE